MRPLGCPSFLDALTCSEYRVRAGGGDRKSLTVACVLESL
jgi:hypothetical protein